MGVKLENMIGDKCVKLSEYIKYLENNKININHNCFIHGDFHYANLLWKNDQFQEL